MKPGKSGSIRITPINLYWTSLRRCHLISQVCFFFFWGRDFLFVCFFFKSLFLFSSSLCIGLISHFQIHNLVTNSHYWLGTEQLLFSAERAWCSVERQVTLSCTKIHFLPVLVHLNVFQGLHHTSTTSDLHSEQHALYKLL